MSERNGNSNSGDQANQGNPSPTSNDIQNRADEPTIYVYSPVPGPPGDHAHWYGQPLSGASQAQPDNPEVNGHLHDQSNPDTSHAQSSIHHVNGHWYSTPSVRTAPASPVVSQVNSIRHGEGDAATSQSAPGSPQMNNNTTDSREEAVIVHTNPIWFERMIQSGPQETQAQEPDTGMHRIVIEFQPPPVHIPVVLSGRRPPHAGSLHNGDPGGSIPPLNEEPRSQGQGQPLLSENGIYYIPICPSTSTVNSTNPPDHPSSPSPPPSPPSSPTPQATDEPIWHEFGTDLTPDEIADQAVLLSTWNEQATTARIRAAEEEAHIRAVELESELESERQRRERRRARQNRERRGGRQEAGNVNVRRSPTSLLSGLLLRLRQRGRHRYNGAEARELDHESQNSDRHHQIRSDINVHLSHLIRALSSSISSTSLSHRPRTQSSLSHAPTPAPSSAPASASASASASQNQSQNEADLCTLCTTNTATLIQGPLSQSLSETIPFVCCQGCLDEILEAEVQAAEAANTNTSASASSSAASRGG